MPRAASPSHEQNEPGRHTLMPRAVRRCPSLLAGGTPAFVSRTCQISVSRCPGVILISEQRTADEGRVRQAAGRAGTGGVCHPRPRPGTCGLRTDAEWLAPPGNATALALDGTHHLIGRDRIVQFLTSEFGSVFVAGVSIDFRGIYADGDTVIVEERMQATLAHGGRYDNDYCFIFELEDGLIKRVREYMDTQRGARWLETPSAV